MRIESKSHLLDSIHESWNELLHLVNQLNPLEKETRTQLPKSMRAESAKDVLAHLHGWHKLFFQWCNTPESKVAQLPAPGFKWNETPKLNQEIFDHWKDTEFKSICIRLKRSHNKIVGFTESLIEKALMSPGVFPWTGRLTLAKYIAPNTTSHYRWAIKKIKRLRTKLASSDH